MGKYANVIRIVRNDPARKATENMVSLLILKTNGKGKEVLSGVLLKSNCLILHPLMRYISREGWSSLIRNATLNLEWRVVLSSEKSITG